MICKCLAFLLLCLCLLREGSALSCYKCVSNSGGECGTGFKEYLVQSQTCLVAYTCYKLEASGLVSRGCNEPDMAPAHGLLLCSQSNCNSGTALKMSVVLLAAMAAAALLRN